jgi:hypothetical protein
MALVLFILCVWAYALVMPWLVGKAYKHRKMIWAVLKTIFAIAIFPALIVLFIASKSKFLAVFTALWPHLDIMTTTKGLYLRRFFMTPKTQWYHPRFLHYIRLSDSGRDPHNHPGPFSTTILAGGYNESVFYPGGKRGMDVVIARPGNTLHNPKGHTHMVTLVGPTWTWVKGWIRGTPWGFWKLDPQDPAQDLWIESEEYGAKSAEIKSWE